MTGLVVALGIDIGPRPGVVRLVYSEQKLAKVSVAQITADLLGPTLEQLWLPYRDVADFYVGFEAYVHSRRGGGAAGKQTQDQAGSVIELCAARKIRVSQRAAGRVKPWATNERLERARIAVHVEGMRHARDGARHALFTAVEDGNIPDPLSRKAR